MKLDNLLQIYVKIQSGNWHTCTLSVSVSVTILKKMPSSRDTIQHTHVFYSEIHYQPELFFERGVGIIYKLSTHSDASELYILLGGHFHGPRGVSLRGIS